MSIGLRTEICGNPGLTFNMVPCFHQRNVYIERKLGVWRALKCIALVGGQTAFTFAGLQTTPSHVSQYRAQNGNLRKSGSTCRHGSIFAPKQCLYQKEATGMESPKMRSSSWCKIRTYLCGTANYPVSCKPVQGRERTFEEIRGLPFAMVPCQHLSNV